jgi:hypothetical protein
MPETINHPTFGPLSFPDGMSDDEKAAAIRTLEAESSKQTKPVEPNPYEGETSPEETRLSRGIGSGAMTAFPGESYGFANQRQSPQQKAQAVATATRYGLPIAATIAAAPIIAPYALGAVATGAVYSGVGAVTGYVADILAQLQENDSEVPLDYRKATAAGVSQAMPVKGTGGWLTRMLFNIPSAIVTQETSEKIRLGDKYELPKTKMEAMKRWWLATATVAGFSYLGSRGQRAKFAEETQEQLSKERFGGKVTLSEAVPTWYVNKLERGALAADSQYARHLYDNMGAGFSDAIAARYPNATHGTTDLVNYLNATKDRVARLGAEVASAEKAAAKSHQRMVELSSSDNLNAYHAAKAKASQDAMVVSGKNLAQNAVERYALGTTPLNISDVGFAKQVQLVNETITRGRESLKAGIGAAYQDAGFGQNTNIVELKSVLASISGQTKVGAAFEGNMGRKEARGMVAQYFATYGKNGQLTLEGMQDLQSTISKELVDKGVEPGKANKKAAALYQAVKDASDRYVKKNMPAQFPAWEKARNLAARDFALRGTPAMEALAKGDVDSFYGMISKEGRGETLESINSYSKLLIDSGEPEAAAAFLSNVNQVIAKGVLHKAASANVGSSFDSLSDLIDPTVLWKELDTLRVNKFPVADLGLGTPDQIKAASRLASVKGSGRMATTELDEFLDLAERVGENRAIAKMDYYRAVRDEQFDHGTTRMRKAQYNTRQAAKAANATAEDKIEAYTRLNRDPLVELVQNPNFKVPSGATNSAKVTSDLLQLEPEVATSFVQALQRSGRISDVVNIRRGLSFLQLNKKTTAANGTVEVDSNSIIKFFKGEGDPHTLSQRASFKALMGDKEYDAIVQNIVEPMQRARNYQLGLAYGRSSSMPHVYGRAGVGGPVKVVGTAQQVKDLIIKGHYNTLYLLYVNERFSHLWKGVMRGSSSLGDQPVLATALRIAQDQDNKEQQKAP